jgi:hypothetical protein
MTAPILHGGTLYDPVGKTGSTYTSTASFGATPHVKGSYTTAIASTPFACSGVWVTLHQLASSGLTLYDVAVGASNDIILPNLPLDGPVAGHGWRGYFPVAIPAGVAISARVQSAGVSGTVRIAFDLVARHPFWPVGFQRADHYGVDTATTRLTAYDTGATINTKNGWTQIVASTSAPAKLLYVFIGNQGRGSLSANGFILFDIGVGGAGSEVVVIPNQFVTGTANYDVPMPSVLGPFPVDIPTGSRLSVNAQCNVATDTTTMRDFDISILALG